MDPSTATQRFTFGNIYLMSGISSVAIIISMFGLSESLCQMRDFRAVEVRKQDVSRIMPSFHDAFGYGQKILHALSNAKKEIADQNNSMAYSLKVATLTTPRIIPKVMNAFRKQYPQPYLQVQQYQRYSEQLLQEVDTVIYSTEFPIQRKNLRCIYEEPIFLAVSKDHPFSRETEVGIEQLRDQRFIRRTEYSDFARYVESRYFEQMGFEPHTAIIADPAMTEIELVASNLGIIFMPQLTCFDQMDKISLVKVKGVQMKRYINITWRDQPYQPKVTQLFVDFIYDFFGSLNFGEHDD